MEQKGLVKLLEKGHPGGFNVSGANKVETALNRVLGGPLPNSGDVITNWSGFAKGFKCKLNDWTKDVDKAKDKKTNSNVKLIAPAKEQAVMKDLRNALFSIGKNKDAFVNFINDKSASGAKA